MSEISSRLHQVLDSIREAEARAGRGENSVSLVAVSKFHPAQAVLEAVESGHLLFGENRVQEAVEKFQQVRVHAPEVQLHIIGSLQRNKVKKAISCASCIQSVDRIDLLEEIEKQAANMDKTVEVLFEFHTGEESKSGFDSLDSLLTGVEFTCGAPHIVPKGFMTMAPFTSNQQEIASSFKKLVWVQHQVASRFPNLDLRELSMGMSNDFALAIAEGATLVRIGTAIFGQRVY